MMSKKKTVNRVLKGLVKKMPAIRRKMKSRNQSSITGYILGGIGFAIAGGIAALMFFSPRTRYRALNAAKGTYGKVNEKIGHLKSSQQEAPPMSNGLVEGPEYTTNP